MFLFIIYQVLELILSRLSEKRQFLQNVSKYSIISVSQESYVYFMKFHLKMPLSHNFDQNDISWDRNEVLKISTLSPLKMCHFIAVGCQVPKCAKNGS